MLISGGEGLVIRRPNSPYTHGRSDDILKLKVRGEGCGEGNQC